jgi:hypothetical protein
VIGIVFGLTVVKALTSATSGSWRASTTLRSLDARPRGGHE